MCLGIVTLFPFDFDGSAGVMPRVAAAGRIEEFSTASEIVHNLLLFLPLGVLLHRMLRRSLPSRWILGIAAIAGLLLSVGVESLQLLLPIRDPTIADVVPNIAGSVCGASVYAAWGVSGEARLQRARAALGGAPLAAVLVAYGAAICLIGDRTQRETSLSNWDASYPVQIGNEGTADRPWRGRVFSLELSDAPASADAVRRFSSGRPTSLPGRTVAHVDFASGAPFHDTAGGIPPLDWTGPPTHRMAGGVRLDGHSWLQTAGPAGNMVRSLMASNAFSIRLICSTDTVEQVGPARIVSNSVNYDRRNVTIAQQGQDMVVRIRTTYTGINGSRPEVVIPDVFSSLERRDVLVTYDGANVSVAVAGSNRVHRIPLSPGPILLRRHVSLDIPASAHRMVEWLFVAVLVLPPAVLVAAVVVSSRSRLLMTGGWVLAFALLFEATLAAASGRGFSIHSAATTVSVGMAVAMVFAWAGAEPRTVGARTHE